MELMGKTSGYTLDTYEASVILVDDVSILFVAVTVVLAVVIGCEDEFFVSLVVVVQSSFIFTLYFFLSIFSRQTDR